MPLSSYHCAKTQKDTPSMQLFWDKYAREVEEAEAQRGGTAGAAS